MPDFETVYNPKSTTSLGKTKMASAEIDLPTHKYWPSVESLKAYGQKNLQATLLFVDFTKAFDSINRGKIEQILLAYGLPKETVAAITILSWNTKVKVRSPDGDSVSSTEKDIDTRLTKPWTAIDKLSIIWKSDPTDKMKCCFFQAAVVSILLYGCTTWTLPKQLKKKLDGNYTRMLRAILNKSWWEHPTRHQVYGHLPPITKTIQVRQTRHAGHCWRSWDKLISDVLLWTPTYSLEKSRTTSSNMHTATMWGYGM